MHATAEAALTAAVSEPGTAHRVDVALVLGPEAEALPTSCWLCANDTDQTIRLACIDLRGETNLRQQLVNAQRTLEQDYWSNRRLEARYRRMLEMVAEGFLVVDDLSGRVLEANSVAGSLLELEEGALVGRVFPVGLDTSGNRALTELQREARSTTGVVAGRGHHRRRRHSGGRRHLPAPRQRDQTLDSSARPRREAHRTSRWAATVSNTPPTAF